MKAASLLLLRISTGIYLILWGAFKFIKTDSSVSISNAYYGGLMSGETMIYGLGALQILVGLLVVIGLFRSISYMVQAVWYLAGLLPIITSILDPFGLYLAENARLTFFPSTTLLFASLVMIAFKEFDHHSLDHKRGK